MLDILLPTRCTGCNERGPLICARCSAALARAPNLPPPVGIDWWTACFAYEGVVREVIARAKYRNQRAALPLLVRHLIPALAAMPHSVDVVTWPPTSRTRFANSGVDHAAVLARAVARSLHTPARALLRRGNDPAQTGRPARDRRRGPDLAVAAAHVPDRILVIDDVATTGGTLAAAARALRGAGAHTVLAATVARTPGPGRSHPQPAYTSRITPS